MSGHTGWVRSLALQGNRLFSCGCNFLRAFDVDRSTPKELPGASLYTGDILSIATGPNRVFASTADGSIHSWALPKNGNVGETLEQRAAHGGRVSQVVFHDGLLYSVSYDGSIKVRRLLWPRADGPLLLPPAAEGGS
jgi:WD40 repeat protein